MATPRCYCYVERYGTIVPCDQIPHGGSDFCKNHLMIFNMKSKNIRVTENRVSYVSPMNGRTILDDTWFRNNEKFFRGFESKLIPSTSSYTWIFVYYMIKRIQERIRAIHAKRIQRRWRECIGNPEYRICRARLTKEASELMSEGY